MPLDVEAVGAALGDAMTSLPGSLKDTRFAIELGRWLQGRGIEPVLTWGDGVEKLRARIGNDGGWRRFDVDTRALAGARHTVTFHVAAMNPAWRNFGFHAEARR